VPEIILVLWARLAVPKAALLPAYTYLPIPRENIGVRA
jgi:hypothetical protein